ncbi:MAG: threonine/serine exporter family protein [Planctomycetota bacterium]
MSEGVGTAQTDRDEARAFLIDMARALAANGTPAHRLEEAMTAVADRLGFEAEFFATPTSVFASIAEPGRVATTTMTRTQPSDINAERLVRLDQLLQDVLAGEVSPSDGRLRAQQIQASPDRYGSWATAASIGVASACAGRFFGGGLSEIVCSLLVGLVVGMLAIVAMSRRRLSRLIEFASGFVSALGASVLATYVGPVRVEIVTLAGVIALLPGLSLTVAINELATRNLVAGGARLIGAVTVLVSIGFGVAMGGRIAALSGMAASAEAVPLPAWTEGAALLIAPTALAVLFRVPARFFAAVTVIAATGYVMARVGTATLDAEVGVSAGAATVGVLCNLYVRWVNRPVAVVMMPAIILLVPGGIGYSSVSSFLQADAVTGVQAAFSALLVAVSLVAGLLLANVAVPPRRSL